MKPRYITARPVSRGNWERIERAVNRGIVNKMEAVEATGKELKGAAAPPMSPWGREATGKELKVTNFDSQ